MQVKDTAISVLSTKLTEGSSIVHISGKLFKR